MTRYTGTYGHKGTSIEDVAQEQLRKMKGFKQARSVDTEFLTKNAAVRQAMQPFAKTLANGKDT